MPKNRSTLLAAILLASCNSADGSPPGDAVDRARLGLMSSLPILWAGNDAFASLAGETAQSPHWAVAALERDYRLEPIDALAAESLADLDVLLLAQPRVLTPRENFALDEWVRGGGRVLLMTDPGLVGDYDFPLGDPRRPLDTAMLSPILGRWGLELVHDTAATRVRTVPLGQAEMAVADAGFYRLRSADGARCRLAQAALVAWCEVGKGKVVLLADATLLEDRVGGEGSPEALRALLGMVREKGPTSDSE